MSNMFPVRFTDEQKADALRREIKFRHSVYERRVADRRMSQQKMDYEIAVFEAILADYEERL